METKHFKNKELSCPCCGDNDIIRKLLLRLERLRSSINRPISLNSAYRCGKYNDRLPNSKDTSSHIKGLAVDIHVCSSSDRYVLLKGAIAVGFNRIGIAKTFIHLDVDESKPANVIWIYK